MPRNGTSWPVRTRSALAVCGALALSACSAKYAQVPARLDLHPYGRIALVAFSAQQDHGAMGTLATERFAEQLLATQGIELLEMTAADSSIRELAARGDGAGLAQALGRDRKVPAVFVGELKLSNVRPRGRLSTSGVNVRGAVTAELSVRLLSTETGGTLWRSSSTANGSVGHLSVAGGLPSVAIRDREQAYGEMVTALVTDVTRDLRPTWVRQ
jgi:hypothetical protein